MLTGRHIVRDVSCKLCLTKLGWIYEYATEENQVTEMSQRCTCTVKPVYLLITVDSDHYFGVPI